MKFSTRVKHFWRWVLGHKLVSGIILVVALAAVYWLISSGNGNTTIVEAMRGSVVEEVTISGNTKAASDVTLAFETSGRVVSAPAKVSDHVKAGDLLVALDQSELLAKLAADKAKLAELNRGTRVEELAVTQAEVSSDQVAVADAKQNLIDKISDAYTKADDAVHNTGDQFFNSPRTANATLNVNVPDYDLRTKTGSLKSGLESVLTTWRNDLYNIADPLVYAGTAAGYLNKVNEFFTYLSLALNELNSSNATEQAIFDGYKTSVASARTNVNTAITNLSTAKEKYQSALAALNVAKRKLDLGQAGTASEEITAQQAQVQSTEAQLAKRVIRSPIDGVVTKQEAEVGELAAAGEEVVSVISADNLEIEAYVPEINVGKVKPGDPVTISLDAFAGETFAGHVISIDPAATLISSVPNYKVKAVFNNPDPRLKSGLTTTLVIQTNRKNNVIIVPVYAVQEKDGQSYVRVITSSGPTLTPVVTGLVGTDGTIEIISGLLEGDKVEAGSN